MLILLNGPINSGKSTLARLLVSEISNTAIVEVDSIKAFYPDETESAWEVCFRASLGLAEGFLREHVNVIFVYHIGVSDFEMISARFDYLHVPIYAFTLKPTKEALRTNRGHRELNEYLLSKIQSTYDNPEYSYNYGVTIDNTHQTPEETARIILDTIKR